MDHLITFPIFLDLWGGFGIDKDKLGFAVVFGNDEKYAFTPQRYDTFIEAANSINAKITS